MLECKAYQASYLDELLDPTMATYSTAEICFTFNIVPLSPFGVTRIPIVLEASCPCSRFNDTLSPFEEVAIR